MERNKVDVAGEDAGSVGSGSMAEPLPMFHRLPDGFVITIPPEDDYDLMNEFERRRYLRIQEVKQRQTHRDRQEKQSRRERLRKELLDDGQKVLKHVQHEFIGIRNILNPFDLKHRMIHEFAELCSRVPAAVKATPMMRLWPTAVRVLRTLKPLPTYSQSRALRARALLNEQLRRHRRNLDWTVMDDDESLTYDAARRIVEVKALRVMELSLRKFVPIPMLRAELWRVKREQMHRCRAKLDAIAHRQQRLLLIPTCRHPYHMRASGCPNCGVIHMGTTGEDNRYVRSRNVDTGVETLIKVPLFPPRRHCPRCLSTQRPAVLSPVRAAGVRGGVAGAGARAPAGGGGGDAGGPRRLRGGADCPGTAPHRALHRTAPAQSFPVRRACPVSHPRYPACAMWCLSRGRWWWRCKNGTAATAAGGNAPPTNSDVPSRSTTSASAASPTSSASSTASTRSRWTSVRCCTATRRSRPNCTSTSTSCFCAKPP